jgi:hypothetical protein
VILASVARQLAAASKEYEVIGAVPVLDDVQTVIDLAA